MGDAVELTTVADDEAVVHDGFDIRVYDGLEPDTEWDGFAPGSPEANDTSMSAAPHHGCAGASHMRLARSTP